jgi:deoxycytidine triphosphate deaminase/intein/homing endonuclease
MILSDRTIRAELEAGRIVIDPLDEQCIQPSSVDLRLDRLFRVFLNHTMPVIDVKEDLEDLTRLVEIGEGETFILHPGEFVLGSTYERVTLPDDLVGRIEGKSSLGRLGLLIHSSLPGSEPVWVLEDGVLVPRPIEDVVRKRQPAKVAAFDPDTFAVGYHDITGWYEGPPDRIYEIGLASGRRIRVTAGHNLFTLDRQGNLTKVRTRSLRRGVRVAVPRIVPDPQLNPTIGPSWSTEIVVPDVMPDPAPTQVTVAGPTVAAAHAAGGEELAALLRSAAHRAVSYYRRRGVLPYTIARQIPGLVAALGQSDLIGWRGGRNPIPARITVDTERAWLLGLYVAEGYRRAQQVVISNTDQKILDRAAHALSSLGLTFHRGPGALTCGSSILSAFLGWVGAGGQAPTKRVPPMVFGWPGPLIEAFVAGVVDGDGSVDGERASVWTTSDGLVGDLLVLFARLGRRAGGCRRPARGNALALWQVYAPVGEHKLLTSLPLPDQLLVRLRRESGLTQADVARRAGYAHATDLNNIERRRGRDAVRRRTLRRVYEAIAGAEPATPSLPQLRRLIDGDLLWDEVVEVRDTGFVERIFDLEVRPGARKIENFLAGSGGVFVSNTAGFIDAGFSGYLTLELSNVANLPITLYPGMKIGQVSFLRMTTPADVPYGSARVGSKYQGQRGPTPSRYWENFRDDRR